MKNFSYGFCLLQRSAKMNHVASFELLSLAHMTAYMYIMMLILGGGGGGCASQKTLIFCPKFLLQSIFSLK